MKRYGYPFSPDVREKALETHSEEELRTATPKALRRIRSAALIRLKWSREDGITPRPAPQDIIRSASRYQIVPEDRYCHERTCDNCGITFCVHIKRGHRVPAVLECPNCGCGTPET